MTAWHHGAIRGIGKQIRCIGDHAGGLGCFGGAGSSGLRGGAGGWLGGRIGCVWSASTATGAHGHNQ